MPNATKKIDFTNWQKGFYAYLEAQKRGTNGPLIDLCSRLGDDGKRELALSIFNFLRPRLWATFRGNRRRTGQQVDKNLNKVIRGLKKLAKNYRALSRLAPELRPGIVLGATAPPGFADSLEAEANRLDSQRTRAKIAFSYKRAGNKTDLAILLRLQYFVDEFAQRSGNARRLKVSDLADLIEAGKAALDLPASKMITDPASIERALQRFRKHPRNAQIFALLKQDAIKACDKLNVPLPASSRTLNNPTRKSRKT
jgi:hypothetical protein